ncbi:DHHA1 domain protein [uncultured archaeon]|nr:DHHA1 domain protein [uncultured archaeon]
MADESAPKWREKMQELAGEIRRRDDFAVVHHYDADGCSAGAAMHKALLRDGKKVQRRWVKQLYKETISEIRGLGKNYVFVDFGAGQMEYLSEEFGDNLFVFDHHQGAKTGHRNNFSPFDFGINGGTEVSASGIAYLFAKELDNKNFDLLPLAVVGAVGDMQDYSGKLIGLNAEIVKEGKESGILKVENDLRLYGRVSRPLVQFLMYSTSPMLPELTANEENCRKFLRENGIETREGERWRTYIDLSREEKERLSTALVMHLDRFGVPEWKISELFGEVYSFPKEDAHSPCSEAKEYSTLINSCGRHSEADVAVEVCLGDRQDYYQQALALMAEHRRQLRDGIEYVKQKGIREEKNFYYFDAAGKIQESIVGVVAGMLYGSDMIQSNKPIIAIARNEDGTLKISGRATKELVHSGINLGLAFREICAEIGGVAEGGGHAVAAGLKLEEKDLKDFMQKLSAKLSEQLKAT